MGVEPTFLGFSVNSYDVFNHSATHTPTKSRQQSSQRQNIVERHRHCHCLEHVITSIGTSQSSEPEKECDCYDITHNITLYHFTLDLHIEYTVSYTVCVHYDVQPHFEIKADGTPQGDKMSMITHTYHTKP